MTDVVQRAYDVPMELGVGHEGLPCCSWLFS